MRTISDQSSEDFGISIVPSEDGKRVVMHYLGLGRAVYSRGALLETILGQTVETRTAKLETIDVTVEKGKGIGSRILSEVIDRARDEDFKHIRMPVPSPIIVKMVERALREDKIKGRAYRERQPDEVLDLASSLILGDKAALTPEQAMLAAGKATDVTCVVEL